jgi:hypothetical protein
MDSRPPWVRRHASVSDHPTGSLRFLDRSFDARRPLPPRRARPLHLLVASRPVSGFTLSGRLATLTCVSRPKRVHARALRLTPSPSQAPTARSPAPPLGRLHGERAIPMVSTFQLTRSTRLPDAPDRALTRGRAPNLTGLCPSDPGTPGPQGLTRLSGPMIVGPRYPPQGDGESARPEQGDTIDRRLR